MTERIKKSKRHLKPQKKSNFVPIVVSMNHRYYELRNETIKQINDYKIIDNLDYICNKAL